MPRRPSTGDRREAKANSLVINVLGTSCLSRPYGRLGGRNDRRRNDRRRYGRCDRNGRNMHMAD
jgi:hypothetical protein